MFSVEIEVKNVDEVCAKLLTLPARILEARKSASLNAGAFVIGEVRKFMESGGNGTWKKPHPLTAQFDQRGGHWEKRKPERQSAYAQLGKFARYVVNGRVDLVLFGFGNFKQRDVHKGRFLAFNQTLQRMAQDMQRNRSTPVTDAMRRKMGATKGVIGNKPGATYFPIPKATTALFAPARQLAPAIAATAPKVGPLFKKKFESAFAERTKDL